ncbi:MAG: imidazole glycerol phosphate synthase subunit HisH [Stagnimonas sp.]|nr:imidazole glycerol phosphate synthase subunit HisH [Stagnimonas sp.]
MRSIGVIDYGMGNLHSLAKALERVAPGHRVVVSYDAEELLDCDRLVLPGVGGVRECMKELNRLELAQLVVEASKKVPMLGICLGMQVMLEYSEENGGVPALGLFPGSVLRFPEPSQDAAERLKVPHMGWNRVRQAQAHPIWAGVPDESWFYFVHSYYAQPKNQAHVLGTAEYTHVFAAAIARENLVAFQFHPEKSQALGLTLLANFVNWNP